MTDRGPQPEPKDRQPTDSPPLAIVRPRRVSFVWLVPVAALLGLAALLVHNLSRQRGPVITITFTQAEGLEPGAEIVHRGIAVGVVRRVRLTPDLAAVRVTAELDPHARGLAREGAAFWVVRPEVSLSRVSGLETILGPRYIAARPAPPGTPISRAFTGLDSPPRGAPPSDDALLIVLTAPRAGALTPGSPVMYRDIPVGVVRTVGLTGDATGITAAAAIDPGHAHLVRTNSRFWTTSGLGVDWGLFRGLSVRADSFESLIRGSVSFATPTRPGPAAGDLHEFELADEPEESWLEWRPDLSPDPRPD